MCEVHKTFDEIVRIKDFRKNLEGLLPGQTLDVPDLNGAQVDTIITNYHEHYIILEEKQDGKYNLNIRAMEERFQNA